MIKRVVCYLLFVSITSLFFVNCSGKRQLEQGNYAEAVFKSVNKLRSRPTHKKALSTLRQAYPLAIDYTKQQIQNSLMSTDVFKWNRVVDQMELVNSLADDISRCPAARKVVPNALRYDTELVNARENAADECYNIALLELKKNNRLAAREAYYLFVKANNLVLGFKDVENLIPQSKDLATLKVVLEQIPVGSSRMEISAQFFHNKVQAYINDLFQARQFLQLYLPREAERMKLVPDQVVQIRFDDFVVGNVNFSQKTNSVLSSDSVKVGDYKKPDGTMVPVKNIVKADFTVFKKEVISKGLVEVKIIEFTTNKILLQDIIPGQYIWACQWASFNGDDRALTVQDKALCKQRELQPPLPQDLFIEFTKPIYDQLTSRLSSFYARY